MNELFAQRDGTTFVGGAHDALTANLLQEIGYEAVWVSSFGAAATRALPDANLLSVPEVVRLARDITRGVRVPVIVDAENGLGTPWHLQHLVEELALIGVVGVAIEDNAYPKQCSLYSGKRRVLIGEKEMEVRLTAAARARGSAPCTVIARTEAMIAGLGPEVAARRARAYEAMGADALLVHARQWTEILAFKERWNGTIPVGVIPTLYSGVTRAQLEGAGIRFAIFANQALRAGLRAMRSAMRRILQTGCAGVVEDELATLAETQALFSLRDPRFYAFEATENSGQGGRSSDTQPLQLPREEAGPSRVQAARLGTT